MPRIVWISFIPLCNITSCCHLRFLTSAKIIAIDPLTVAAPIVPGDLGVVSFDLLMLSRFALLRPPIISAPLTGIRVLEARPQQ